MASGVRDHFEAEAHEFDGVILRLIPFYPQMLDALVTSIPFPLTRRFPCRGSEACRPAKMICIRYVPCMYFACI